MDLYRAVDQEGNTVDFLLTRRGSKLADHKFLLKAIRNNGCPKIINIDKSGANKEAQNLQPEVLKENRDQAV